MYSLFFTEINIFSPQILQEFLVTSKYNFAKTFYAMIQNTNQIANGNYDSLHNRVYLVYFKYSPEIVPKI